MLVFKVGVLCLRGLRRHLSSSIRVFVLLLLLHLLGFKQPSIVLCKQRVVDGGYDSGNFKFQPCETKICTYATSYAGTEVPTGSCCDLVRAVLKGRCDNIGACLSRAQRASE